MADAAAEKRMHWRDRLRAWCIGLLILAGFVAIAVWVSGSWRMGSYFVGGLAASVVVLGAMSGALLAVMRRIIRIASRRLPAALRHGFANVYRPGNQARAVFVALGVGVMFTSATFLLQQTVLREVKSEGPGKSGNVFLLDVRNPSELAGLVGSLPGIEGKLALVGVIPGRIVGKNGVPVEKLARTDGGGNERQNVRLATAAGVPDGVLLKEGRWWVADASTPELAVSERAQKELHLRLNDRLEFQVAGQSVSAPVVAIFAHEPRGPVRYDFVLPNSALNGLPVMYFGAIRVNPANIPGLEEAVFNRFPTVTVLNLADVFARIQDAVDQVALVIRFVAGFAIAAGLIILCSSVAGTRYARIREVAIFKTLGAMRRKIISIFSVEFLILGAVSGAVGGLLANIFARLISSKFLDASFRFDWPSLVVATIGTALLASLAGWVPSAGILRKRPLEVLRDE